MDAAGSLFVAQPPALPLADAFRAPKGLPLGRVLAGGGARAAPPGTPHGPGGRGSSRVQVMGRG